MNSIITMDDNNGNAVLDKNQNIIVGKY